MSGHRSDQRSPQKVVAELERAGLRLLRALAEPGTHASRRDGMVVVQREKAGVSLSAMQLPTAVLAPLLSSGAVSCLTRRGATVFVITAAGRAKLFRENISRDIASEDVFGAQHRQIETRQIERNGSRESVQINLREDTIEVLARQRDKNGVALVEGAEKDAGARLSRDLSMARMSPHVTLNWSRLVVDGGGKGELSLSESAMEARRRVSQALQVVGPDFSGILVDLCAFSKGIETIEKEHGLPVRSGKVVIAWALRALARHYGLSNRAEGPARAGRIQHWGSEGYKPRMQAG